MFTSTKKPMRLLQWYGPRYSSRSGEPLLVHLRRWAVQLRLAPVLATMGLVTSLAFWWGPPVPYRVGQTLPTEVRVRKAFDVINQAQTERAREETVRELRAAGYD